ncbi:MAG: tail protein X [Desulfobacterium sp.]|nr:tail protein X [Desulfobacterium sp.]
MHKPYITTQGDTWDIIAFKLYGNEKAMDKLIEANPAHRDTVFFSANVSLVVPVVEMRSTDPAPPWRQV